MNSQKISESELFNTFYKPMIIVQNWVILLTLPYERFMGMVNFFISRIIPFMDKLDLQNCNKNLNDSLKQVCTAKGLLEAREEELTTLLKLKVSSPRYLVTVIIIEVCIVC